MKAFFLFFLLLFVATVSFSQSSGKSSLGLEVGFPTGSGSDGIGTGFGGSYRYEGRFKNSDNANWLVSFGYISFPASGSILGYSYSGSISFIPITLGARYYPTEAFRGFYFGGEMGVSLINAKVTVAGINQSGSGSENKFTFAPSMGVQTGGFDLTLRYSVVSDANYFGIRAAFTF